MAKNRYINTKFWSDSWVRQTLNPLDRYLFLYFLTNEHTSICGIYELPLYTIAFETGLDKEELVNSFFPRLEPKIIFRENWVIIPKFVYYQNQNSPTVIKGISEGIKSVPPHILEVAIGYGYDIQALSHSNLNSNLNLNSNATADTLPSWLDKKVWEEWLTYRKEIKKKMTTSTISRQLSFLETHKQDHAEIIRQSIQNGWTGLFGLKNRKQKDEPIGAYPISEATRRELERPRTKVEFENVAKLKEAKSKLFKA